MTALVLKTLSDLGCGNSRWNEELHFSVDETFFEEKNNPRGSSLSQKFSCRASFFKWRQNLLLYHMYHFGVGDENKVDQSLIFFFLPAFLQGRMTS